MVCVVSGVHFRDGTLAHWVIHSVGVSLRTPNTIPSVDKVPRPTIESVYHACAMISSYV